MAKDMNTALPLYEEIKSLNDFLIQEDNAWETPDYIKENLVHTFRYYQSDALRYFHYSQTDRRFRQRKINHVLFHMATGSGKTDLMVGLILYLYYEHGYQNFLFLVNTIGVLNKTVDNLTNQASEKYLLKPNIEIAGERIELKRVKTFPNTLDTNTIYIKFATVQSIAHDLFIDKENTMGKEDYQKHKVVILGDEAHHYSAATKKEVETERSWEKAIATILHARSDNKLLEFTATIDLENTNIYEKYKDKVLYRYTLDRFMFDRFSKNVRRIQSKNTDEDNMMNVILLSEYRRRFALEKYHIYIKPVIMFKSQRIAQSHRAHETFNTLVARLTAAKLKSFIKKQEQMGLKETSESLYLAYRYYKENEGRLEEIVREMKREFAPSRIINANDTSQSGILEKGHYEALNSLESPRNLYRVIFAVARLTEGWDVLNLFDIVRLSDDANTKGTRKSTLSEAQLIGRGARYYPFLFNGQRSYKRRFQDESKASLLLETLHYHTVNEPEYLKNLVNALDEMNLPTEVDKKRPFVEIEVKPSFKRTAVWKHGKIYFNETVEVDDTYYDSLQKYGIDHKNDVEIPFLSAIKEKDVQDTNVHESDMNMYKVPLTFDMRYINKVMNRLSFYHFVNLKKYVPQLTSREEFLGEKWLNIFNRTIYVTLPGTLANRVITPEEKLQLIERYFTDVAIQIKAGYNKRRGTNKFIGYPIREYITDYRRQLPLFDTITHLVEHRNRNKYFKVKDDFFIYDAIVVNHIENQLIEEMRKRIESWKQRYEDVYLIHLDKQLLRGTTKYDKMKLYPFGSAYEAKHVNGFCPNFILYLKNEKNVVQIFIDATKRNVEEMWRDDLFKYLNEHGADIVFENEAENVKIKGVRITTIKGVNEAMQKIEVIVEEQSF